MRTVAPETVGLTSQRLRRIDHTMQAYVDDGKLPGVVTVVARRGQIAHAECVGWMDVEARKPMRFDTLFRLHSMTKPITSVAVMMLYEQGYFQLYDPISRFLPEFQDMHVLAQVTEAGMELCDLEREITVRDLLLHTSGLASGYGEDQPLPKSLMPVRVGPNFTFDGHGFGLGFRVLTSAVEYEVMGSVGEYGWSGYAGTYFWVDPAEELIGLFMPQIEPLSYVPMWHAFRVLTYQAIVD